MYDLLIRKARIADDRPPVDVAVRDGKISAMEPSISGDATTVIDADGKVLIPGLVESHIHLDKALIADRKLNKSGTLKEAIDVTAALKPTFTREDVEERATRVLKLLIQNGVTHIRTHSEFDPSGGFTGFEVIMELRERFKGICDLQVVAFPQEGIIKAPGTLEMMYQAMDKGADVVGGIPYNDTDPHEHTDIVFEIAGTYDKPIDLHQDFKDDADALTIEYICKKTIETGWHGRVSVGHLTALGALPPERLKEVIALMAEARINVMTLPATDLHLGGRGDAYNIRRAITPVRALRDGGVNVCIGTNNIRNAFTPYGNGDPFLTAMLSIAGSHLGGADDLRTVLPMMTTNPARALALPDYGLNVGSPADAVLLSSRKVMDAVIDLPTREYVIKNGRVIVHTTKTVDERY